MTDANSCVRFSSVGVLPGFTTTPQKLRGAIGAGVAWNERPTESLDAAIRRGDVVELWARVLVGGCSFEMNKNRGRFEWNKAAPKHLG